jgi:hypothetical protein
MITFKNILKEENDESLIEKIAADTAKPSRGSLVDRMSDENKKLTLDKLIYKYTGNKSIEGRTEIWRGKYNENRKIIFMQPSKFERKSLHTYQIHTLLIDNSKFWIDYPKRSKSISCSTEKQIITRFGDNSFELYKVVPKLNAIIGLCPHKDMWNAFNEGFEIFNRNFFKFPGNAVYDIESFNSYLKKRQGIENDDTFEIIKNKLENFKLDEWQMANIDKYNCNNLYEFIDYCLSPQLNGFGFTTYDDDFKINGEHEVWTDADSLMITDKI